MYYVDTHCHLYSSACEDLDGTIKEAKEKNVLKMINPAEDIKTSYEVIEISKKHKNIYPAVGIHPENIPEDIDASLKELEEIIKNNKLTAIGEIGLDYYWTKETKEKQLYLFEEQLKLAEKYSLPVIIHSREATQDTIETLKKYKVKGVIHSYTGSLETARIYIKMGFLLGINGVVTFKNCNLKEILNDIGVDNLIFETDSPYLSPVPFRGKINSPKNVSIVYEFVSNILAIEIPKLQELSLSNISRIFDI